MKFDFPNQDGEILSGRLELPSHTPRAFALFAHCFTCSKNVRAAATISRKLTDAGIAVLRFDFTGLGNSEGDFSNTNFSSNVQDLVSACQKLGEIYQHPQLLIGHSLGGAAVLKAASLLPDVRAVVTLAAPSDAAHVSHMFEGQKMEINDQGEAEVELAGRKFTIKKQFLDDIDSIQILEGLKNSNRALLVMHSPTDNQVSIEHATKIFMNAKHPKSFVSL
ncbi:MAG: alpha/beta hydrolase, partial [Pseudomonadota bacterium]